MCLPVVVFSAIDARLAGKTGQGRVEWPSAFVTLETLAMPGFVNGNQVVAIDDLEPAAGTHDRCCCCCCVRVVARSYPSLLLLNSCRPGFMRKLLCCCSLGWASGRVVYVGHFFFQSLFFHQMMERQKLMALLLLLLLLLEMMIEIGFQHGVGVVKDRLMMLDHFSVGQLVVVVVVDG